MNGNVALCDDDKVAPTLFNIFASLIGKYYSKKQFC